ncbi:MAG: hypothetical protein BGO42_08090 [Flavobacterium sp. 40-81]|nr:MAG: hypothetical protein BGO42_08090 [Flavobacterium sp. 40-81]
MSRTKAKDRKLEKIFVRNIFFFLCTANVIKSLQKIKACQILTGFNFNIIVLIFTWYIQVYRCLN